MTDDRPPSRIKADPDLIETYEGPETPSVPDRFSAGDIVLVVLLLAFTVGWPLAWVYVLRTGDAPDQPSDGAGVIMLAIMFVPAAWSALLATDIVHSRLSR